jgi:hypothetical protein
MCSLPATTEVANAAFNRCWCNCKKADSSNTATSAMPSLAHKHIPPVCFSPLRSNVLCFSAVPTSGPKEVTPQKSTTPTPLLLVYNRMLQKARICSLSISLSLTVYLISCDEI